MRTKSSLAWFLVIVCMSCEIGCRNADMNSGTDPDNFQRLADGIMKADKAVVFEGLPHQLLEASLLEQELKNKKTIKVEGYPFYEAPLELKAEDAKELTRLVSDAKSFRPYTEGKKCGGFHPDYLVEWRRSNETYRCQICFGCNEIKMSGPKAELHFDLVSETKDRLEAILKSYRKNRPVEKDE